MTARGFLICGFLVSLIGDLAGSHRLLAIASANLPRDNQEPQGVQAPAGGSLLTGTLLTERFVYLPVYLHPRFQDDSDFSYVGRQTVTGRKCYVLAFAQIPEAAHLRAQLNEGPVSHGVLLQGLVWADPASFQIIRMFTQLLPVATESKVREFNTDVTYGEVRFPGIAVAVWLPSQVVVDIDWIGKSRRYRNYHHYSNYQLYAAQSKIIY